MTCPPGKWCHGGHQDQGSAYGPILRALSKFSHVAALFLFRHMSQGANNLCVGTAVEQERQTLHRWHRLELKLGKGAAPVWQDVTIPSRDPWNISQTLHGTAIGPAAPLIPSQPLQLIGSPTAVPWVSGNFHPCPPYWRNERPDQHLPKHTVDHRPSIRPCPRPGGILGRWIPFQHPKTGSLS